MAYITVTDLRTYSGGVDVSAISDDELTAIISSASALCDSETNNEWSYQTIVNEPHDLETKEKAWEIYPYSTPVRIITGAFVSSTLNVNSSDFYKFTLNTGTTPGPSGLPVGTLPTNFGSLYVDRYKNVIEVNFNTLQFGISTNVLPYTSFLHPLILLSYTSGYDNGTVQSDGYSYPAPTWLREATRLIAASMVSERNLAAQGLSGVQEIRQGQTEFRRATEANSGDSGFTLPAEVRNLLRRHRKTSLV